MDSLVSEITLDQIDDWFKIGKSVAKSKVVPRSKSKIIGRDCEQLPGTGRAGPTYQVQQSTSRKRQPTEQYKYAETYRHEEAERLLNQQIGELALSELQSHHGPLSCLEADSIVTDSVAFPEELIPDKATEVYDNYTFSHEYNPKLPITHHKEEIVDLVENNQVVVIQGGTGSGKTTQVPQYILDHYAEKKQYCNIIVTQPRRIAARSIAVRVCQERGWELGTICGYQVSMEKQSNDDTRLLYATTGTVLEKLICAKDMCKFSHVIIDEVHERDQYTDLLLMVVRKFLRSNSRHVKVILMSATLDSDEFAKYFAVPVLDHLEPAPVIDVEGIMYKVSEFYVEDLLQLDVELPDLDPFEPGLSEEIQTLAVKLIQTFDTLEAHELGIDPSSGFAKIRGSVLAFLPGIAEIESMDSLLQVYVQQHNLLLIPLHSSITIEEQAKVFQPAPESMRKVILSTNIAESSITVPDIKYVIDFCLTKHLIRESDSYYTCLRTQWASKANSIQRKGRAGRVAKGRVYRMITRQFWECYVEEYSTPEMQRCPLEQVILKVKMLNMGEPKAILGLCLAPPNLNDIESTILLLKEVGAFAIPKIAQQNPYDGKLTFVGQVLAQLPVDIRIGKLLVLGHVFGVLEECIIIGAAMSVKSIFSNPFKQKLESYRHKLRWSDGSFSDCIALLNAYKEWSHKTEHGYYTRVGHREAKWGRENYLQIIRMKEVAKLVRELECRLMDLKIHKPLQQPAFKRHSTEAEERLILKLVFCGAFYPNYFLQGDIDETQALRTMSGKDPTQTVMFKGLPANQGILYKENVERFFETHKIDKPVIHFEETRAYAEFVNPTRYRMGNVPIGVYLALKLRQLNMRLVIQTLSQGEAHRRTLALQRLTSEQAESAGRLRTNRLTMDSAYMATWAIPLPSASQSIIEVHCTAVKECGHFWVQHKVPQNVENYAYVLHELNNNGGADLQPLPERDVKEGVYCAAPFTDNVYYRARIEEIQPPANGMRWRAQVFYMDFGNCETVPLSELRVLDPALMRTPFLGLECCLTGIRPSVLTSPSGQWSEECNRKFAQRVSDRLWLAKIYSVVGNVMRMEILLSNQRPDGTIPTLNEELVHMGLADKAEESYLSKQNHEQREMESREQYGGHGGQEQQFQPQNFDFMHLSRSSLAASSAQSGRTGSTIHLTGPTNPLEMTFHSVSYEGKLRPARVVQDSVNSIVLDDEPHDKAPRFMVAAMVMLNPSLNTSQLRDTTILPHLPGLPALVALLFAPAAELRADPDRTHNTGVLCGLGYDENTGAAIFPDHDMEITFDTKIDCEDIAKINGVRMAINIAIGSENTVLMWGPDAVYRIQANARQRLLDLIRKRRQPIETPYDFYYPYHWNQVAARDILHNELSETTECPIVFNLHDAIALTEDDYELNTTSSVCSDD